MRTKHVPITIRITPEVQAWLIKTYGRVSAGVQALAVEAMRKERQ